MEAEFRNQSDAILQFLSSLQPDFILPEGVEIMNPFTVPACFSLVKTFYEKYYADPDPRYFIFGINPGRLGGGITGIPFTDPKKLEDQCRIPNPFMKKSELSADFIYAMISAFGGPEKFYSKFFITALCPLGFTKKGKNLNYYDDKQLARDAEPFITLSVKRQLENIRTHSICYCLGEGENLRYFKKLNEKQKFFTEIIPLPHPRWIMQYRRKSIEKYISLYLEKFSLVQ